MSRVDNSNPAPYNKSINETTYRANRRLQESRRKPAEGIILSGVREKRTGL